MKNRFVSGEFHKDAKLLLTSHHEIDFTYDPKTEALGSCAASLRGTMFVFGGRGPGSLSRQVNIKNFHLFINAYFCERTYPSRIFFCSEIAHIRT